MSLYVEVQYTGDWWGEDPLTETEYETTGDLFRALSGQNRARRWQALGRCTGKVYIDSRQCDGCKHDASYHLQFTDAATGHAFRPRAVQVGWVFVARNPEPVNRGDTQPTGLREAWVTVKTAPDTVVRTPHYAAFPR